MALLTPKQLAAVGALLEHGTATKAAAAAGVSVRTLSRWQADLEFKAATRKVAEQALDATIARLRAATAGALDTLIEGLRPHESAAVRVRAAQSILDFALKADADELRKRIEALEWARKYESQA